MEVYHVEEAAIAGHPGAGGLIMDTMSGKTKGFLNQPNI